MEQQSLNIVTVDDEEATKAVFGEVFDAAPEVRWTHLYGRDEAIKDLQGRLSATAARSDRPDLIVIDLQLDEDDRGGLAVLDNINRLLPDPAPDVFVLSVSNSLEYIQESRDRGASYLWKGGSRRHLRKQVTQMFEGWLRGKHDQPRELATDPRVRRLLPSKVDAYLGPTLAFGEGGGAKKFPVLVRVRDPQGWRLPDGFRQRSRLGCIISGSATAEALRSLDADENVVSVEASRPGGVAECAKSVPLVKAPVFHNPPMREKGNAALVGIIDEGIDVLHATFTDDAGRSRIIAVWDQADQTGPTPQKVHEDPDLGLDYGTVYTADAIEGYRTNPTTLPPRLYSVPPHLLAPDQYTPNQHGTHVASIAAGRAVGGFAGGVAPAARIAVVIPDPNSRDSIGYSNGHVDALAYLTYLASRQKCPDGRNGVPVVVNMSVGKNAGAHDGTTPLEVACDEFCRGGEEPGMVVVKSAGNERQSCLHARLDLGGKRAGKLRWYADLEVEPGRYEDVIELWFRPSDGVRFRLRDPDQTVTPWCPADAYVDDVFPSGNHYTLTYRRSHTDNKDSQLLVRIRAWPEGAADESGVIRAGPWELDVEAGDPLPGPIHAWIENGSVRSVRFEDHVDPQFTITIPGTAGTVLTVAAVESDPPQPHIPVSSAGPTRTDLAKPDLAAPGHRILAAGAGTSDGVVERTGTSMAAPHVTGLIALVLSARKKVETATNPVPTANAIRAALINAQAKPASHSHDRGYGLVNAEDLLRAFGPF